MCVWGRGSSDRGSSLSPIIGISFGAFGQELFSSKIHPTLWSVCHRFSLQNKQKCAYDSYSESSKILCSSRSTWIVNPASISALVVLGERAARRSNTFFSQRSLRCWDMEAGMRRKNLRGLTRGFSKMLCSHDEISAGREHVNSWTEKHRAFHSFFFFHKLRTSLDASYELKSRSPTGRLFRFPRDPPMITTVTKLHSNIIN